VTSLREAITGETVTLCRPRQPRLAAVQSASSYVRVDPSTVTSGGIDPTVLHRTDGQALLYPGVVNVLHGPSEAGKSWLALLACSEEIKAERNVLFLDYEDVAASIFHRLGVLGCAPDVVAERFVYVRPEDRMGKRERADLQAHLELHRPSLVVIDGVTEALDLEGLDSGNDTSIARFRKRLSRPCAALGAVVLEIDHPVKKAKKSDRGPSGSGHKIQGIEGAVYSVTAGREFAEGCPGSSCLTITKDRPGRVRSKSAGRKHTADVHFDAQPDGSLLIELVDPMRAAPKVPTRPVALMKQFLLEIEANPGINTRALHETATGRQTSKTLALETLVAEEFARIEEHGQAHRYFSLRPYPNDDAPVADPGVA
jgi:hypothetical protein